MQANQQYFPDDRTIALRQLLFDTEPLLQQLKHLTMGFCSMCCTVRAVQRNLLEIEAYINYFVLYSHQGTTLPPADSYALTVGAYLLNIKHIQRFQLMGIYYWLIHPYTYVWHAHVEEIACMQFPVDLSLSADLLTSNGPICVGSASNPAKYSAIRNHGRDCLRFPDPFHSAALPELLLLSASPSQSAHRKHCPG